MRTIIITTSKPSFLLQRSDLGFFHVKLSIDHGCEDNERPHARPQEPLTVDGEPKLPLKGFSDLAERAFQSLQVGMM